MKNLFYLLLFVCINPHLIAQTYDTLALKVGEVYNFNVGDEFHRHYLFKNEFSGDVIQNTYYIDKILSKSYAANNDTVYYGVQVTTYNPNDCGGTLDVDTIQRYFTNLDSYVVTLSDSSYVDTINWSSSYYRTLSYSATLTQYNGRRVNTLSESNYTSYVGDGQDNQFIEGCGRFDYNWSTGNCLEGNCWDNHATMSLLYYKKGAEEWGTPIQLPPLLPITPTTSMTIGEAYDFDIGDEFQFVRNITIHDGSDALTHYFVKRTVTDKLYDNINNLLHYTYLDSVHYYADNGTVSNYVLQHTQTVEHLDTLAFNFDNVVDTISWNSIKCQSASNDSCQLLSNTIRLSISGPLLWHEFNFIKGCGVYYKLRLSNDIDEDMVYLPQSKRYYLRYANTLFYRFRGYAPPSIATKYFAQPRQQPSANRATRHRQPPKRHTTNHRPARQSSKNGSNSPLLRRQFFTPLLRRQFFNPLLRRGKGGFTHDLPNGMYLVSYTQQGLLVGRAKMVVQH